MTQGCLFDIKEFALNDGPGIRTTLFFKGCPLRCLWCHNPEGLCFEPQLNKITGKKVGTVYTAQELADRVLKFKDAYDLSGGGVTFSGGEPTAQPDFLQELIALLPDIHKTLDTSGLCASDIFRKILPTVQLVYFDLKEADSLQHQTYTGQPNQLIIENLMFLAASTVPYHLRLPLIPQMTDTAEHFEKMEPLIRALPKKPESIDLLPYNKLAGGKYAAYGMTYPLENNPVENDWEAIKMFMHRMVDFCVQLY